MEQDTTNSLSLLWIKKLFGWQGILHSKSRISLIWNSKRYERKTMIVTLTQIYKYIYILICNYNCNELKLFLVVLAGLFVYD